MSFKNSYFMDIYEQINFKFYQPLVNKYELSGRKQSWRIWRLYQNTSLHLLNKTAYVEPEDDHLEVYF